MIKVGIIGCGNWGSTLAHVLSTTVERVLIWGRSESIIKEINEFHTNARYTRNLRLASNVIGTTSLAAIGEECELIFIVLPTQSFREIVHKCGHFVSGEHIIVSATKGMEDKTFKFTSEIIREETCCKKVGVLAGPNIAEEIIRGQPAGAVIASQYREVIDRVRAILNQPLFKVYASSDVKGVEVGGALKNIIAIAAGISEGLGFENNSKSLLMTRGLGEVSRFGLFFGADPRTFLGLSGMGDMITTCFSPNSRNHRFGKALALGKDSQSICREIGMVVEGVNTTKVVYEVSERFNIPMPITSVLYNILFKKADVRSALEELMAIEMRYENEGYQQAFSHTTHMLVNKYPTPEYLF